MGISKEAEISIAASSMFPGFRFSPTDEELLLFYLKKKMDGFDHCVEVINEVDICKNEPWDLPAKSVIKSDHEWFFFSPRGKKYPNGSQSKRATDIGYWKATGKERSVKSGSEIVGTKRTLVFHIGRAPKGERTEWIMHEYCLLGNPQESLVICRLRRKNESIGSNLSESYDVGSSNPLLPEAGGASSGTGWDTNRISAGKAVQCCPKEYCSCSHGSDSVEQYDHASESGQKLNDEGMEPESSSQPKVARGNAEDDCFADILKDNIIELDETALPTRTTSIQKPEAGYRPTVHPLTSEINFSQGTAKRRIRLKKIHKSLKEESEGDSSRSRKATKKLLMRYTRITSRLCVVMMLTGMLASVFIFLESPLRHSSFCLCSTAAAP